MVKSQPQLKAPFPYFGGKSRIVSAVWKRLGTVVNAVDPFCGSCAFLLGRPLPFLGSETVNDANAWLTNAWRSIQLSPKATAKFCDWPVSELDLHSRGDAVFYRQSEVFALCEAMGYAKHCPYVSECPCKAGTPQTFIEWCRSDCTRRCAAAGGIWVWGCCAWIGDNWGYESHNCKRDADGEPIAVTKSVPHLNRGQGVNRKLPHLGDRGRAILEYLRQLSARLRDVRVCCGDWTRVLTETPTTHQGLTAVFLDPPYAVADRDSVYGDQESYTVAHDVHAWCVEHGDDPLLRIALCGYEEHDELANHGWAFLARKTGGGYGTQSSRGNENAKREKIWFNRSCLNSCGGQRELF